jgi:hypothetical protein
MSWANNLPVQRKSVVYFDTPGFANTATVIETVIERVKTRDIETVVVPATTGKTADLFVRQLNGKVKVAAVSENEALSACKRIANQDQGLLGKLIRKRLNAAIEEADRKLRRDALDMTFLPFCGETYVAVSETLYAFGQGMKVALEVSVAAVEVGKVEPYSRIIAVGGTGEGADTAIVVRTSPQSEAFGQDIKKRLAVCEILAMPIEKF